MTEEIEMNQVLRDDILQTGSTSGTQESALPRAHPTDDDIAVIGLSCRFPGGDNPWDFHRSLVAGENLFSPLPYQRWVGIQLTIGVDQPGALKAALLDDVLSFDPVPFSLSPRESETLDPHHRLLLEEVYRAISTTGNPEGFCNRRTGVFVAMYNQDFAHYARWGEWDNMSRIYLAGGNAHSMLANRISYLLDLRGPSEIINTACSSSLAALHRACQSIRHGECAQAIVGGVSLLLEPGRLEMFRRLGMLSLSGICAPFDAAADGQIIGEGVAAAILKPLRDARRDGDQILAVIIGSGVDHQGRGDGSLIMPSAMAQVELISNVLARRGLSHGDVTYVEAHGNGGAGDEVELLALWQALGPKIRVGSVKGNIGFLEAAGGLSQLTKLVGAFRYGIMPATLNHNRLPDTSPATATTILTANTPLKELARQTPFVASLHSYGVGGVNAYLLLVEPPPEAPSLSTIPPLPKNRLSFPLPPLKAHAHLASAASIKPPDSQVADILTEVCCWIAHQAGLEVDDIDADQPIAEYGLDSVALVNFFDQVRRRLAIDLSPVILGPRPTPRGMANIIEERQAVLRSNQEPTALSFFVEGLSHAAKKLKLPISLAELQAEADRQRVELLAFLRAPDEDHLIEASARQAARFEVLQDERGDVWVFLRTGKGNTFDIEALEGFIDIFAAVSVVAKKGTVRALYISHHGRVFSLGGDRQYFVTSMRAGNNTMPKQLSKLYKIILQQLEMLPCITLAVAYGGAQGGGLELMMATDMQVVWPNLGVGFPEVKSGIFAGMGGISYTASVIGKSRAMRLNLTGELLTSNQAVELGLLSHLSIEPFRDAREIVAALPDLAAALRIRKVLNNQKMELLALDLDAWADWVGSGEFLAFEAKIHNDFSLIAAKEADR